MTMTSAPLSSGLVLLTVGCSPPARFAKPALRIWLRIARGHQFDRSPRGLRCRREGEPAVMDRARVLSWLSWRRWLLVPPGPGLPRRSPYRERVGTLTAPSTFLGQTRGWSGSRRTPPRLSRRRRGACAAPRRSPGSGLGRFHSEGSARHRGRPQARGPGHEEFAMGAVGPERDCAS